MFCGLNQQHNNLTVVTGTIYCFSDVMCSVYVNYFYSVTNFSVSLFVQNLYETSHTQKPSAVSFMCTSVCAGTMAGNETSVVHFNCLPCAHNRAQFNATYSRSHMRAALL